MTNGARVFDPVSAPTTYDETVARLGTAIRIGVLAPGTRLPPERILAERLGISRSTLRLALGTLTASGHLVATRGRSGGTFVAPAPPMGSGSCPPSAIEEIVAWRLTLELGAAHLAAERLRDDGGALLRGALEAVEAVPARDWAAYRRADVVLHLTLAEVSGCGRLVPALAAAHGELFDALEADGAQAFDRARADAEHRRLVEAVLAGDAAGAGAAMRDHVLGDAPEPALGEYARLVA